MMNRLMNAGGVIEENGAGLGVVDFKLGEYDGHAPVRELIEHGLFLAEGHDSNAIDFALEHAASACGQHGRVAVGGTDENLIAASDGDLFETLDQFREEW